MTLRAIMINAADLKNSGTCYPEVPGLAWRE